MKFGVVVFPGSNCDRDVVTVTRGLLGQPTRMIWHTETDLSDCEVVVLPGGFSYGDYLRCGAIARFSPVMQAIREHVRQGRLLIGICNGFQVLTEAGLLPGALVRNRNLQFVCDRLSLRVERNDLPWTRGYRQGEVIAVPVAHGEGCYYAEEATLQELEEHRQVVLRYCNQEGEIDEASNPNGSLGNIAGICNRAGNVLGMMPHPERVSDPLLGGGTDGRRLFESLVESLAVV
ncbi:phosphoribosylformylglycinamidine synthase subunit PurQ [Gloeobacter kilaueensis]|uniref:Phosphoribosylformylglycinamidine synthase subunit PurQ n=1 Tax=Gloeobacter kilaueensis (strain ATCC BAA-2537 / CCAP 1431/1 / ULC 316 / JS1) TaxID=1183438 RepID=U5QNS6_GLOK1|nr:phosphoribosylformylglycinamidine synthase subunit PurQ [Gloeobacter kilaueensis]AGY59249.1 phosphoribosylformylglycinamidine synthase I [Gloeobacter kilaueensis JS1]